MKKKLLLEELDRIGQKTSVLTIVEYFDKKFDKKVLKE